MNWNAVGAVGEVVGALGVIVTLGYLAVQIRQSSKTTRAEMLQQHSLTLQGQLMALGSNAQASRVLNEGLRSWDDLSEEEQAQFSLLMAGTFQGFESTFHQYRSGLLAEDVWQSYRTRMQWYVARTGVRAWWKLGGHTWISEAYGDLIDELVRECERSDS